MSNVSPSVAEIRRPAAVPRLGHVGMVRGDAEFASRNAYLGVLFVVCCANGLGAKAIDAVSQSGWSEALLGTFGISLVVWVACYAGLSLVLRPGSETISPWDIAVGIGVLGLVVVPFGPLSWMALSALALYVIVTSEAQSFRRRGAWILLAVTVPMCWSRLLFAVLARWILEADAVLVSWMVGTERIGNTVQFSGRDDFFQIYPACSSLANMSLAVLCWATATQVVGHRASKTDILWCGLACVSVVVVNIARISLIGFNREHFGALHGPLGTAVASWITLFLMAGICYAGVRHDLKRVR
jgi:exosortase/archaeosortase family protein